jgi:HD-GYP domain-containing protein (c-di-GMP phosphodiesterase class II)
MRSPEPARGKAHHRKAEAATLEPHREIRRATIQAIHAISAVVGRRDAYTALHQRRVATLARALGERLAVSQHCLDGLYLGGLVHDIGKVAIPAELLVKPGRLAPEEYALIKTHVPAGCEILDHLVLPWPIRAMIAQHHERLDGSGYPDGLTGDAITLEARIIAVADVFEAMSSHRPYRAGLGLDAALGELQARAGTGFDAEVVAACTALAREHVNLTDLWTMLGTDPSTTSTAILPILGSGT